MITYLLMKKWWYLFLLLLAIHLNGQAQSPSRPKGLIATRVDSLSVPASIRALQAVSSQEVWFAGSNGIYGHTLNAGQTWQIDSIVGDSSPLHFRSIAITDSAVHLLTIGSPALLFRSTNRGESWQLVYQEDHPAAFYDAMHFWDKQHGIAMGAPTDGCLSVIRTDNGGASWTKVPCSRIPPAVQGEAAFAASNSNLALQEKGLVWMVSGGKAARVYKSTDYGRNWQVRDSPIISGGQMTGIYAVTFYNKQRGIIIGGDWNEKSRNRQNKAVTQDGGQSWQLISDGNDPGYQSCVDYRPGTAGSTLLSCGIPGAYYTQDSGNTWKQLLTDAYYTLSMADSTTLWMAGHRKVSQFVLQGKQ